MRSPLSLNVRQPAPVVRRFSEQVNDTLKSPGLAAEAVRT